MSYDEQLAQRVRLLLRDDPRIEERAMFGGRAFLMDGRMCCGVVREDLVARVGGAQYEAALEQDGVRPMDFTGRPMNGYVYVGPEGYRTAQLLERWVQATLDFVVTLPRKAQKKGGKRTAPTKERLTRARGGGSGSKSKPVRR